MAMSSLHGKLYQAMACLCLMTVGIPFAKAEQFGSTLLDAWSSCPADMTAELPIELPIDFAMRPISDLPSYPTTSSIISPIITATKATKQYSYASTAYRTDGVWQGSLLKYRTVQGVMVGVDGVPIYQNHQMHIRQDLWATGQSWQQFGTQGQHQNSGLWLTSDKFGSHLVNVATHADIGKLTNYPQDELDKIANLLNNTIGAVMYPADIDGVSNTLLYADTQGVLRLVDADGRQLMALLLAGGLGELGVDAAWRLYRLNDDGGERLVAVGGFGRSHTGLAAWDISDVAKGGKPVLLYQLSSQSAGFEQLSHIHAPISLGYIKQDGKKTAVFVFGAGVDGCYHQANTCHKQTADGAAVYAINALSGQKVSEWSGVSLPKLSSIRHSFAGEVTLVDRQGDGVFEQVYAADLGGQIFRFDAQGDGAVRVFAANDDGGNLFDDRRIRFYQKPIVSLYDSKDYPLYPRRSKRFALVSIASNDQLPIIHDKPNFVYGIVDDGLLDLQQHPTITPASLVMIDDNMHHNAHLAAVAGAKGWQRAIAIHGDTDVTLMGAGLVTPSNRAWRRRGVHGLYHLSVVKHASCPNQSQSQAQTYCLPFGVCGNSQPSVATDGNGAGVLTSSLIDGYWVGAVAKFYDRTPTWQALRPTTDDLQPPSDDTNNNASDTDQMDTTHATMTKLLRFLRWYDVRSTKE